MSAPPYMKLFWGDYHKATRHLSRSEHGAYFLLIGEAWRLGGSIPNDDAMLARWTLSTDEEWASMRRTILAFFTLSRGKLVHKRVREELEHYKDVSCKRKQAGKVGGSVTAGKGKGNSKAFAEELPIEPEPEPEPEPVESGGVVIAFEREAPEKPEVQTDWPDTSQIVEVLHGASGPGLSDRLKTPGLIQTSGVIVSWRQGGCSWELDVLPTVRALTAKARGSPISTWAYFSNAVVRARDQRLQPLPEPQFIEPRNEPANRQDAKREQLESALRRRLAAGLGASER